MYVVTVKFTIDPRQWASFLPQMLQNAEKSRAEEPGCQQFDVCIDGNASSVFLYEIYESRAAFDAHIESAHFQAFDEATRPMIVDRTITTWQRIAPR
jgi:quinol monooxygenase YgiN